MNFLHKDRLMMERFPEFRCFELGQEPLQTRLRATRRICRPSPQPLPEKSPAMRYKMTRPISAGPRIQPPMRRAVFAYLGNSSRIVIGPATGTIYRFRSPGARLRIDPRDAAALQKLAALRAAE